MGAISTFVKGAATVLPEIKKPTRKPSLNEKLIWTGVAVVIYMVMAVTPLTGVPIGAQSQFSYSSVIFASAQGTLMTLGIGPIVTAGLILQLLAGSEIIKVDFQNPDDRAIFTSATKLLTIIVIVVESSAYLVGGLFGSISPAASIAIFFELLGASIIVMLLDELVQKGWGIGSGVSLFILAGVAQKVMWDMFSPLSVPVRTGVSTYLGAVPYLLNATFVGHPLDAVFRTNAPNFPSIFGLLTTVVAILVIVYVEGMRIEIPITSTKYRGFAGVYPIKLLYVSNIPVILFSALVANISFFFAYLWKTYDYGNGASWFNYLAQYNMTSVNQQGATPLTYQPLPGSLIYYMTSPNNILVPHADYVRALTYVLFAVAFSVMFAKIWVEIGGLSPKAAAKNLIGADVMIPGFRRTGTSVEAILAKYIPVITIIGGIFIGLLASLTSLFGVFGTGVGLLLMVDIIIQYYQMLVKEQLESMMPRLGALLGRS
ncbi:MAG: preprotein translocase subunit SecY [Nitrososphaerales archaeon]